MANPTGAFGLKPVRHIDGSPWNGATVPCYVGSNYGTAMFIGDPVLWSPTAADKDTTGHLQTINVSAGTDGIIIWGAVVGFDARPANLTQQYNPASTERIAYVCADPTVIFHIRDDGGGTPTKNWVGANANMIATGAGSTVTGLSGFHLDGGTTDGPDATQTNPLLIVGLADLPDNALGDNAIWEVLLNTHFNATGSYLGVVAA